MFQIAAHIVLLAVQGAEAEPTARSAAAAPALPIAQGGGAGGTGSILKGGAVRGSGGVHGTWPAYGGATVVKRRTPVSQVQVFKSGGIGAAGPAAARATPSGAVPGQPKPAAPGEVAPVPGASLPPLVLRALEAGPLTPGQARALVELLVSSNRAAEPSREPTSIITRPADLDLLELGRLLEAASSEPAEADATGPAIVDAARLRRWFTALDRSSDAAVTFLEWCDRTGGSLDAFLAFDRDNDGRLSFEELARPLVVNEASDGGRGVDPELLEWALEREPTAGAASFAVDLSALTAEELVQLARAEIAADKARRATRQVAAQVRKDAGAVGTGAKAADPGTVPGTPAAVPPRRN